MATGGKVSNEVLNNSLKLPKDLAHPQGTQWGPQCPPSNRELLATVSCCRPISTPQILPVLLLLPLFPGWDLHIFQGVFHLMSSSPKGVEGGASQLQRLIFTTLFLPLLPAPFSSCYSPLPLGSLCPFQYSALLVFHFWWPLL